MNLSFLRARRLLKFGALGFFVVALLSSLLFLNYLSARAAPPTQGPITITDINHVCFISGLEEVVPYNDTYDVATVLIPGQMQRHTLDSGGSDDFPGAGTPDKDWFSFTTVPGQLFTVTVVIPDSVVTPTGSLSNLLTLSEISLFTSTAGALEGTNPVLTSTNGELAWMAATSPATQTFWARIRNPGSAAQNPANDFCDYAYDIKVRYAGNLNSSETAKLASVSGSKKNITFTIVLDNLGELVEPVTVTDTLPANIELGSVTTTPPDSETDLITTTTSLTWTGYVTSYSRVSITVKAAVVGQVEDSINVAWITSQGTITRASPALDLAGGIFLPIIFKSTP